MNKAIFLDRDGVINRDNEYYTFRKEDFVVNNDVFEALSHFQAKGYLLFVITNQSGIAKGLYKTTDVDLVHNYLNELCKDQGVLIAGFYYCPHHPDAGNCICRKPDSELVEKALAAFDVDPNQSWFIGDRERDIQCAQKAGVKGILIEPNASLLPILQQIQ